MSSGEKRSALLKVRKLVREAREGKGAGKGQRHRGPACRAPRPELSFKFFIFIYFGCPGKLVGS